MFRVCIQNLFLSVDMPPVTVNGVCVPISVSVTSVRARYLVQAVARSVDSVDAADSSGPGVSTLASTCGSWEIIISPSVVFDCGSSVSAGTTSWCG